MSPCAISAKNPDSPDRAVVADAPRIDDGSGGRAIGAGESLQKDVIPSPQPMCAWTISRGPGVARSLSDESDGRVVQVATDDDEPMLRGVRNDEPELLLSQDRRDVSHRTQVG